MSASSTEAAVAKNELESLFGLDPGSATGSPTDADSARAAFDALFDDKPKDL